MISPIPLEVVYTGLAGSLLALIVAAATNGCSLRVFFLLALRLAIGWHFLFEGLHKIHSHIVGPTEWNRPFSSELYFASAQGPFGEYVRKTQLGDPQAVITALLTPSDPAVIEQFRNTTTPSEQAEAVPPAAAAFLESAILDPAKQVEAKAAFARWVFGTDRRDADVPYVSSGDVPQSAADRLRHLALMRNQVEQLEDRQRQGLGNGLGFDQKRLATARAELRAAESRLAADAEAFLAELILAAGGQPTPAAPKPIERLDQITMYAITGIGACLLFGLFTPLACLAGAGFLILTYLTHPPFPWYPLPPNTEGNPLFINKNVIECLALLTIAVHPTGRWLGLDAWLGLAGRLLSGRSK
jgi:uncharacterized membrane protein YphA (DoxX/SURF4 family)